MNFDRDVIAACAAATVLMGAAPRAAPPHSASTTPTGLAYVVLAPAASARHPSASDDVLVIARGWMADGQPIESPDLRGRPYTYHLRHLMVGWREHRALTIAERELVRADSQRARDPQTSLEARALNVSRLEVTQRDLPDTNHRRCSVAGVQTG